MSKSRAIRLDRVKALLLLLLEEPLSKLDIQKLAFLLSRDREVLWRELKFEPYYMGQYSEVLDYDIEELSQLGLVRGDDKGVSLTEEGLRVRRKLIKEAGKFSEKLGFSINDVLREIEDLRELRRGLSEDEFLLLVYRTFPEFTVNSAIKDDLEKRREEIAISLYVKGKVSLGKAAEIAGMSVDEFMSLLRRKGIEVPLQE